MASVGFTLQETEIKGLYERSISDKAKET